ncbi:MAG: hypothetical protein GDA47_01805 [Rhodospirillales bacterium]|nr:hypothetical protein [Rhodospirillales bacterium]
MKSISKFCIALSAAALLTLGSAGQAQSQSAFKSLDNKLPLNDLKQGLSKHFKGSSINAWAAVFQYWQQEIDRKARLEQERIDRVNRQRERQQFLMRVEERQKNRSYRSDSWW